MNRRKISGRRIETAPESLEGRLNFALDDAGWQVFHKILDRPVEHKPRLARLLSEPGVLD
ncbi:MAG: DUF1778 domain-containing protein [Alphaproteobacteria bacterium]|nr:DUF1778 domain-containing protein [Alphaproteobacteria bacterium]